MRFGSKPLGIESFEIWKLALLLFGNKSLKGKRLIKNLSLWKIHCGFFHGFSCWTSKIIPVPSMRTTLKPGMNTPRLSVNRRSFKQHRKCYTVALNIDGPLGETDSTDEVSPATWTTKWIFAIFFESKNQWLVQYRPSFVGECWLWHPPY